jgi:hypothetical protein
MWQLVGSDSRSEGKLYVLLMGQICLPHRLSLKKGDPTHTVRVKADLISQKTGTYHRKVNFIVFAVRTFNLSKVRAGRFITHHTKMLCASLPSEPPHA